MGKISYETHFKSKRADGRHMISLAAFDEKLRNTKPKLALPEDLTKESFEAWRIKVKERYRELLRIPELKKQESPVKLLSEQRDRYRMEKWEFYPDEYTVVPFLVLIPDSASKKKPAPGVICLPGSVHSKEFLSDEPLLAPYNCRYVTFPECNKMASYLVKNGMVAFVFDNVATSEVGMPASEPEVDDYNYNSRAQMVYGYLQAGICYPGMSTYIILSFLQYVDQFDFVDQDRLAVSAHSLGTEAGMALAVLCDEIKAMVFNDFLHNDRVRFYSNTESPTGTLRLDIGDWHIIPGWWEYFDFPDLCAAIAPKYLAFNEGGADEWLDTVRRAYKLLDAEDKLQIGHYPKYQDEQSRIYHGQVPRYGLSFDDYLKWNYCDAPEHSFKIEPSLQLLKKAFKI